jgi:hypothetical protein
MTTHTIININIEKPDSTIKIAFEVTSSADSNIYIYSLETDSHNFDYIQTEQQFYFPTTELPRKINLTTITQYITDNINLQYNNLQLHHIKPIVYHRACTLKS